MHLGSVLLLCALPAEHACTIHMIVQRLLMSTNTHQHLSLHARRCHMLMMRNCCTFVIADQGIQDHGFPVSPPSCSVAIPLGALCFSKLCRACSCTLVLSSREYSTVTVLCTALYITVHRA